MRSAALVRLVFTSCVWWNEIQTGPVRKNIGVLSLQRMKRKRTAASRRRRAVVGTVLISGDCVYYRK